MREATNRLLEFLTAPAKPTGDACRANPRRRSSARAELSWLEGRAWRAVPARLRDISKGGASLLARSVPPPGLPARIRITEGEGSPWVEATILGAEPANSKHHRVRVAFVEPCPKFFLGLAVFEDAEPVEKPSPGQEWVAWTPVA